MTHDLLEQLSTYRPTTTSVSAEWSADDRAQTLSAILAEPTATQPQPRLRFTLRRIAVAVAAVAAAAITAGVLLPANSPGGPDAAAAATLERLAVTAGRGGGGIGANQFALVASANVQPGAGPGWNREDWTAPNGDLWFRDTLAPAPSCEFIPFSGSPDFSNPSAAFLAALPTDPDLLRSYLRAHVSGSTSTDEAVFVAVGDLMRGGLPAPALRAATIRVLEHTTHITVDPHTQDATGRPAIRVDFVDQDNRPDEVQSLYFDPDTSKVLEERDIVDGSLAFRSVITRSTPVDSVPASVRACPTD